MLVRVHYGSRGKSIARKMRRSMTATQENTAMSGTEDTTKGAFHEIKGKIKEEVGKLTDSPELEIEGNNEKNLGKVQKKIGQIKKVFGK
jgi:uncharacterized protein YjbJ (UPF0337 family)